MYGVPFFYVCNYLNLHPALFGENKYILFIYVLIFTSQTTMQRKTLKTCFGPFSQKGTNNGKDMAINF